MGNISLGLNTTEIVSSLVSLPGLTTLIKIFQTAGIILIFYLIFLFFRGITNYKKYSKIRHMDQTLSSIEQSLAHIEEKFTGAAKEKNKK